MTMPTAAELPALAQALRAEGVTEILFASGAETIRLVIAPAGAHAEPAPAPTASAPPKDPHDAILDAALMPEG